MSSMHSAVCGNRSETSMPLLPYFLKVRLVPSSLAFGADELILRFAELGRPLLPVELVQQRLGIERLQVARPARHEQEDHRLGLGSRHVRRLWARADSCCPAGAAPASCCSIEANASAPKPQNASRQELAAVAGDADVFGHG